MHTERSSLISSSKPEKKPVSIVPGYDIVAKNDGTFGSPLLSSMMRSGDPGIYLINKMGREIDDLSGIFTPTPELQLGRNESTRGVTIGQLFIQGSGIASTSILVANSPGRLEGGMPETSQQRAIHEIVALDLINLRIGSTFNPIGFIKGKNEAVSVLTEYQPRVTSMDNIFWRGLVNEADIKLGLEVAAKTIISLASIGLFNEDLQVKNVATTFNLLNVNSQMVSPFFVDIETIRNAKRKGQLESEILAKNVNYSMGVFLDSIKTKCENDEIIEVSKIHLKDNFYDPIVNSANPHLMGRIDTIEKFEKLIG